MPFKHNPENVVAMRYYTGKVRGQSMASAHTVHICVDELDDGHVTTTFRASSAIGGVIERAALCVGGLLLLDGQHCTPERYITLWRAVQSLGPMTLDAWLHDYQVWVDLRLPRPASRTRPWLQREYEEAKARLFGDATGKCNALLSTQQAFEDAVMVVKGLAAFEVPPLRLAQALQVEHRLQGAQAVVHGG